MFLDEGWLLQWDSASEGGHKISFSLENVINQALPHRPLLLSAPPTAVQPLPLPAPPASPERGVPGTETPPHASAFPFLVPAQQFGSGLRGGEVAGS